jgi:hypothetical protein
MPHFLAMNVQSEQAASADGTLHHLLNFDRQKRDSTPIRRSFLQDTTGRNAPAPMATYVAARRARALDMTMLLHCAAGSAPWDVGLPAMTWARALAMPQTVSSETTISKNWTWIEEQQMIRSERHKRLRRVFLLQEDGSGAEYERPDGRNRGFFRLPFAYFLDRWHKKLKMSGKVVLLIALSRDPEFILPAEHACNWYKVSPDTIQRGLDELRKAKLLSVRTTIRTAPAARYGVTQDYHYRLLEPFAR